jgi:ATP-binding protein involved in chromosome partitioning
MEETVNDPTKTPGFHPSILRVMNQKQEIKKKLAGIKHKIGIYSAKGGVGKTTISVNVAYTLSQMGYKVGLLDADIDCPNLTLFLGIEEIKEAVYPLKPVEKDGVKVISTAMFLDDTKKPIIWRGPLVTKMLSEFFENTDWGELDYLIVDLSPGTSDGPLSIMQLLDLKGFVIVTTPQHIAAVNAIRSGRMAKRMGLAVLGVIENMSEGEVGGAREVAEALQCEILGTVKMDKKLSELSDKGVVPVMKDTDIKDEFDTIVKRIIS